MTSKNIFYQQWYNHQIQGEAYDNLSKKTTLVTFDGVKGSGKSTLAINTAKHFLKLDSSLFEGSSGILPIPLKVSAFGSGRITHSLHDYLRKIKLGESIDVPWLDFDGHLLQYGLALSYLAYEKPALAFIDRSQVVSLSKLKMFQDCKPDSERIKMLTSIIGRMDGKYIVPDISVILMCGRNLADQRQEDRSKHNGRTISSNNPKEIEIYDFLKKNDAIPKALYLNSAQTKEGQSESLVSMIERILKVKNKKGLNVKPSLKGHAPP